MFKVLFVFVLLSYFMTTVGFAMFRLLMYLSPELNEIVAAIFGALFVIVIGFIAVLDEISKVKIAILKKDDN
jgi:hypothetical protein